MSKGVNSYTVKKINIDDFFSRTTGLISTKRGTEHPWVKGIRFLKTKDLALFLKGDYSNKLIIN